MEHSLKLFDDHSNLAFSIESTHEEKLLDLELEQDIYALESYINILTDAEKSVEMLTTMENMDLYDNVSNEAITLSFEASLSLVGLKEKTKNINKENIKKKTGEYKDKIKDKSKAILEAIKKYFDKTFNKVESKLKKLRKAMVKVDITKTLENLKESDGEIKVYGGASLKETISEVNKAAGVYKYPSKVKTGYNSFSYSVRGELTKETIEEKTVSLKNITRGDIKFLLNAGRLNVIDIDDIKDKEGVKKSLAMSKEIIRDVNKMVDVSITAAKKFKYKGMSLPKMKK